MSSNWIMQLPSMVFTRIKTEFSEKAKEKYKMTDGNFSTKDRQNKNAVFPFVYINMLPAVEYGEDLDGTEIHGGMFSFQIDVYDNQTQERSREVMIEVINIMKSMRFRTTSMPSFENGDSVYRMTARFQRMIGVSDVL